jgi:peptide deformylase
VIRLRFRVDLGRVESYMRNMDAMPITDAVGPSQQTLAHASAAAGATALPILIAPHALLKARARPVGPADEAAVRAMVPRMFASMYRAPGIGLAAPQVGQGLRVITIDLMPDDKPAPLTLINPEILALSPERATREEGCLSLPGQYADVTRPARVKVRYLDQTGARREVEADGLLSACLQHEIDHLDGILFVDHLSALKRNIIMRRLAKEQRQKNEGK